jgi:hypothetical protein
VPALHERLVLEGHLLSLGLVALSHLPCIYGLGRLLLVALSHFSFSLPASW